MASTAVLECRQLSVSYAARSGDVAAVVDFDLTLRPGETHGLVGESGCGKSTIALAIMRHLGRSGRVVSGEIRFEGRNLLTLGAGALRRLRGSSIAMIYQEPLASLNPAMTLGEQLIEVPMCHDGASRQAARGRARSMLERVRLPDVERILRSYPHQISGGQQQRVVIAMALLANPRLLLLDEPTTALDVTVEAGIVDLIRELAAEFGTTMLYISHNLGLMRETCDRVTVMYAGEAVERGPVEGVFRAMRHPYTQGLFAAIPAPGSDRYSRPLTAISGHLPAPDARPPGCVFGPRCGYFVAGRCDHDPIAMHEVGLGHASRCVRVAEIDWKAHPAAAAVDGSTVSRIGGDPVLRVDHLSKYFEKVSANDDLSFDAWRGETVAIVGESGCGKSTFAKILMGLTQATSGSIELADVELARVPVTRRSLDTIRSLQMIFQNPFDTLNPSRTVGAQIARAIRKFGGGLNSTQIRQRMLDLLDRVKLPRHFADRLPRQLSGGQKQRVGIARAFAGNPAFVVADEPLSALDVSVQAAVTEMLLDMQRRHRTTLLFISHDLSVVRYLADRVIVMYQGRIMEQGLTQEVFAPPYHPYTEALLAAIPIADPRFAKRKVTLLGDTSSSHGSTGCRLNSRCPRRIAGVCATVPPPVREFSVQHRIACHLPREELSAMQPVFFLQPIVEDLQ